MLIFTAKGMVSITACLATLNKMTVSAKKRDELEAFIGFDKAHLVEADPDNNGYKAELSREQLKERLASQIDRIGYSGLHTGIPMGSAYQEYYALHHDVWQLAENYSQGTYAHRKIDNMHRASEQLNSFNVGF